MIILQIFLADCDETQPRVRCIESDGPRMVECDSTSKDARLQSDGANAFPISEDEGYETPNEEAVQSGIAIAYVLSKIFSEN